MFHALDFTAVIMEYSVEECVFPLKMHFLTNRSLNGKLTMYGKELFRVHKHKWQAKSVIQRLMSKSEHTGSVLDEKYSKVSAKGTARTSVNVEVVRNIIKVVKDSISYKKNQHAHMSISYRNGAERLQRLPSMKYYDVLKLAIFKAP